jgi:hypothetical protein
MQTPLNTLQEARAKHQRICALAVKIAALMSKHPHRHEAVDALDVARIFFRPEPRKPFNPDDLETDTNPLDRPAKVLQLLSPSKESL